MPRWSASFSWQRSPCGPSATLTDSRPSRGMPLSCQKLRPEHSEAACGATVHGGAHTAYEQKYSPPGQAALRLRYVQHGGGGSGTHMSTARPPPPGSSWPPGPPQARRAPRVSRGCPGPVEEGSPSRRLGEVFSFPLDSTLCIETGLLHAYANICYVLSLLLCEVHEGDGHQVDQRIVSQCRSNSYSHPHILIIP